MRAFRSLPDSIPTLPGFLLLSAAAALLGSSPSMAQNGTRTNGSGTTTHPFLQSASQLPALPPTATSPVAPLSATAPPALPPGHRAEVSCSGGLLSIQAQNSSLNGILRAIARCTGMRITGGVAEQRVFGTYGPAAPATVLATLIDGTGSNMLLRETAGDQPAELILSPRTGGATPPPPSSYNESENDESSAPATGGALAPNTQTPYGMRPGSAMAPMNRPGLSSAQGTANAANPGGGNQDNVTPVPPPQTGSAVTSPSSIPQPFNNVNGNPANVSPTASTYPTTNSVPLDAVATPSTTPASNGIVDAPNPPAPGSDTAAAMNGSGAGTSSGSAESGNTGSSTQGQGSGAASTDLTPEQIFQQLQQRQQNQQNQQNGQAQPQANETTNPQ